jgi:hypothetical protein
LPNRWRDLIPAQVFTLSTRVAEDRGGVAFTLNLNEDVERSLSTAPDRVAYMARRISRALSAAGLAGTPYAFQIEEDTKNGPRLHLHGVIIIGDVDPEKVKAALMQSGGKISGRAASRQIYFDTLSDAGGWAGYCSKPAKNTRRDMDRDRLKFVSPSLKNLVRGVHHQESASRPRISKQKNITPAQ